MPFLIQAMRVFVPKWISMTITVFQIGQMVLAVYLNLYAIYMKRKLYIIPYKKAYVTISSLNWTCNSIFEYFPETGVHCERSDEGIKIHFSIYFSYLVLFAHYFYKAYIRPKGKMDWSHVFTLNFKLFLRYASQSMLVK